MMRLFCAAILAACAAAAPAPAAPQPVFRTMPTAGVRHYLYEVIQTINGTTRRGYRTEFDLESDGAALFERGHQAIGILAGGCCWSSHN